jgi:hypothetical protein
MSDAYSSAVEWASSSVAVATPAPEPSSWSVWNASDEGYVSFGSSNSAAATYNFTEPVDTSGPGFFQYVSQLQSHACANIPGLKLVLVSQPVSEV